MQNINEVRHASHLSPHNQHQTICAETKIRCKWCLVSKLFIFNLVVMFPRTDLSISKYLPINYIELVHFASHRIVLLWLFTTAQRISFVRSIVRPSNHSFTRIQKDIPALCRICDLITPNAKQFSVQFNWNFYDKRHGKKNAASSMNNDKHYSIRCEWNSIRLGVN